MLPRGRDEARFALALSILVCQLGYSGQALAAAPTAGPAMIDAGPFAITPTLGLETKYSDNIYLQEEDTTESWIYIARPAVNAMLQDRSNIYQFDYMGEAGWYNEDSQNDRNDYFDNTFSADAYILPTERWIATAYISWAMLHEDRGTGLTEGEIGNFISEPVRYDQTDAGGSVEYGSGIGRLELRTAYMSRDYQNFRQFTRSRDLEETSVGSTFFYPIAPKTDLLLDYNYSDFHYPNTIEELPPLDSKENTLQAGLEWEITPNLISTAQAGYTDKSFEDPSRRDWDGITWMLELWMQPRPQDTIVINGTRAPEETSLQGDFILRETLTTTWTHSWSDRVSTSLAGTISRESYEQSVNDRKDWVYNTTVRADYEFRRWCNTYFSYAYDDKDSNADNLSYTANTFMIGVDLSL